MILAIALLGVGAAMMVPGLDPGMRSAILVATFAVTYVLITIAVRRRRERSLLQAVEEIVLEHIDTLARRRDTLVRTDHYGIVHDKDWQKERTYFLTHVVLPSLEPKQAEALKESYLDSYHAILEDRIDAFSELRPADTVDPDDISPLEFEGLCAKTMREAGWNASTTQGSGDQGADVIAKLRGVTIVIQCKLYKGSVGNKAVQEVISARQYYGADSAAVVTTAKFTKSARQLAATSDVALLDYKELAKFAGELKESLSAAV